MDATSLRKMVYQANAAGRVVSVTLTTGRKLGNVQAEGNRFYGADFKRGIIVYFTADKVRRAQ